MARVVFYSCNMKGVFYLCLFVFGFTLPISVVQNGPKENTLSANDTSIAEREALTRNLKLTKNSSAQAALYGNSDIINKNDDSEGNISASDVNNSHVQEETVNLVDFYNGQNDTTMPDHEITERDATTIIHLETTTLPTTTTIFTETPTLPTTTTPFIETPKQTISTIDKGELLSTTPISKSSETSTLTHASNSSQSDVFTTPLTPTENPVLEIIRVIRDTVIAGTVVICILVLVLYILGFITFFKPLKISHHTKDQNKTDNGCFDRRRLAEDSMYCPEPHAPENSNKQPVAPLQASVAAITPRVLPEIPPSELPGQRISNSEVNADVPKRSSKISVASANQRNASRPTSRLQNVKPSGGEYIELSPRPPSNHQLEKPDEEYVNVTPQSNESGPRGLQQAQRKEEEIYDDGY